MMIQQFGIYDLAAAIITQLEEKTGLRCYDYVPQDAPSPLLFCEVIQSVPVDSKTMFATDYTVHLHVIAPPEESNLRLYQLIQEVEEALTEDIAIPDGYTLVFQSNNGLLSRSTDPSGEPHAILAWVFRICYGFKIK